MNHAIFRVKMLVVAGVLIAATLAVALPVGAEVVRHSTAGDLFYNEYVPPVGPNSVGAQMYPCPRPTAPVVGQTYITYQPLMPQEFLYKHHRVYKTKHDDSFRTRTSVRWW